MVIALKVLVNTPIEVRLCDETGRGKLLSCGVTSQENSCVKSGLSTEITQNFSPRQPIHILSKPYPWDSYSGVEGRDMC